MADQKDKTLSYRRAQWIGETTRSSLENYLRQAHGKLQTIGDRTVWRGGHRAKSLSQQNRDSGGFLMHVTTETPGEAASVVPHGSPEARSLNLTVAAPPKDGEWLDGDAFLFVKNDHVCMCTTGVRDSAVASFLYALFEKAVLPIASRQFQLVKVADINQIKLLHAQGVEELEIRGDLHKATSEYVRRKSESYSILGVIGRHIMNLLEKPHDVTQDGLHVTMKLHVDKRHKRHISLGYKRIEALAENVVNNFAEDDDYLIITKTGQKLRPSEIFIKSTVSIQGDGKTVKRDDAWDELGKFFDGLESNGVLEQ